MLHASCDGSVTVVTLCNIGLELNNCNIILYPSSVLVVVDGVIGYSLCGINCQSNYQGLELVRPLEPTEVSCYGQCLELMAVPC